MRDNPPPSAAGFTHSGNEAPLVNEENNLDKTKTEYNIEVNMTVKCPFHKPCSNTHVDSATYICSLLPNYPYSGVPERAMLQMQGHFEPLITDLPQSIFFF
jgi:hypothetical protein